jgi:hypothetical protein
VCRCFRGALPSASKTSSISANFNLKRGRSDFFRRFGKAPPMASRTFRRCTPSFLDTPVIVQTPNSYSRRICSNSFVPRPPSSSPWVPNSKYSFLCLSGRDKMPHWATTFKHRNHGNAPLSAFEKQRKERAFRKILLCSRLTSAVPRNRTSLPLLR